jgi:exopolysaccharide biosynthesis polyprenyl glycosylphosphotransferase
VKFLFNRFIIVLIDQMMLTASFIFTYWLSFHSGLSPGKSYIPWEDYIIPFLIINVYWLLLFAVFGLYGKWKNTSRFDEIISLYKTITVGAVLFVIIAFSSVLSISSNKLIAFGYWASLIVLVGAGRLSIRTVQRALIFKGVGLRSSLIVGTVDLMTEMIKKIKKYPALGYNIVGIVPINISRKKKSVEGKKVLGSVKDLHDIIKNHGITDVLIALEFKEDEEIFNIISAAGSFDVDFSILPGPSDVLSGRMMFNQLYGFPMIRILAEPIPPWEKNVKRLLDLSISILALVLFSPLILLMAAAIKLDSKGPVFYMQERIGYRGRKFKLWKYRSMIIDAEKESGPIWADKNDSRVTRMGKILRRLRLDELPQIYNIIKGDMSIVGPRPEREFFVEKFKKIIPYYSLRLKVKPGLTGWAQIKHNYDRSLDDVREKLKYDLYYIENMSLNMDFKILIATIFVVVGQKGAH